MTQQTYLIDTNVVIGLEDHRSVEPSFAAFIQLASKHKVDIFIHEVAKEDLLRDKNAARRKISLSKLQKFQILDRVRGLGQEELESNFGKLNKVNDVVDATLLHALLIGVVDFLVTQDRRLHDRARRHSAALGRRVFFVDDAVQLLRTSFETVETPLRYIEEVSAHAISLNDSIFVSLREDYALFDTWWREKCVATRRRCWVVYDGGLAGLVVRKDESPQETDARGVGEKILKICTFKVRPESRGTKLGELLLKKIFWYAQINGYDTVYLTTFDKQNALIDLLDYFGFRNTGNLDSGELIYEKQFSKGKLLIDADVDLFDLARLNYPRFALSPEVPAFGIPIKETYHDILFPDLRRQLELFSAEGRAGPSRPGNTIRKVYLCRAPSNLGPPGSILFFYKGKSVVQPSQALTAVGILEDVKLARSTKELTQLAGGRSVYSETDLTAWDACTSRPVKVINFLLNAYIEPPVHAAQLRDMNMFGASPPQSIFQINPDYIARLLPHLKFGFEV